MSNPFSTRFIRPGAIPFIFPDGITARSLVAQLGAQGWSGQIIGPHGTGKSTLLAALLPEIIAAGRQPLSYTFHDGIITLPGLREHQLGLHAQSVLVIDGYEQLGYWKRWQLRRVCRRAGSGMLITAHAPLGFPDLYHTSMTPKLASRVLSYLNAHGNSHANETDLATRLFARQGNLREAFFDLYDLHEQRRREMKCGPLAD